MNMAFINTKDDLMRLLRDDDEIRELLREIISETVLEVQKETLEVQREILAEIRGMRVDIKTIHRDLLH